MDHLIWLLKWFYGQCDGDWEHGHGIEIKSVGIHYWALRISLDETELQDKLFQEIRISRSGTDVVHCYLKNMEFCAHCVYLHLSEALQIFHAWAEQNQNETRPDIAIEKQMNDKIDDFAWLLNWCYKQPAREDSLSPRIEMGTLDNPGWFLTIALQGSTIEKKTFEPVKIERSKDDWLRCFVRDEKFEGPCGPLNIPEVLQFFRDWVEHA